jgi:hypothetical protein
MHMIGFPEYVLQKRVQAHPPCIQPGSCYAMAPSGERGA